MLGVMVDGVYVEWTVNGLAVVFSIEVSSHNMRPDAGCIFWISGFDLYLRSTTGLGNCVDRTAGARVQVVWVTAPIGGGLFDRVGQADGGFVIRS